MVKAAGQVMPALAASYAESAQANSTAHCGAATRCRPRRPTAPHAEAQRDTLPEKRSVALSEGSPALSKVAKSHSQTIWCPGDQEASTSGCSSYSLRCSPHSHRIFPSGVTVLWSPPHSWRGSSF